MALFHHKDGKVRGQAENIAGRLGGAAVPALIDAVRAPDPRVRYHAVCVLRDLASDARAAIPVLRRTLSDRYAPVCSESARALALMGTNAAPAVPELADALSHRSMIVRVMSAGALAAIGRDAAPACGALVRALSDRDPAVRRCAADALAAIGPEASVAVPELTRALGDRNVVVRVCSAGALGSIGSSATAALPELRAALEDPATAAEAQWAVGQITGIEVEVGDVDGPAVVSREPGAAVVIATVAPESEWPMFGGSPSRNAVSLEKGLPESWDLDTGQNVSWVVELGDLTYGAPIVAGGRVFITSGYHDRARPGLLLAVRARDGTVLWMDKTLPLDRERFLIPQTTSSPLVEGDRLYYLSAMGHLRCLDTHGFTDGENDGPVVDERDVFMTAADRIWELDLVNELGVFAHEATNCSVVAVEDLLLVCTSNGVDESHKNVLAPRAPSFIAVNKLSGAVEWRVVGPSPRVFHGQWSSPAVTDVNGRLLGLFGGGDGWLYALEALTGREVWRFDGNPKNSEWRVGGDVAGAIHRNNIIAPPVVWGGRVYLAMGQDPEHGNGRGRLQCIDPGGQGDVTESRSVWTSESVGRAIGAPIIHDGVLYLADYNGLVHCIGAKTGERIWTHDVFAGVWGALLVAEDNIYVGDEDGTVTILQTGRQKKVLGTVDMRAPIYAPPCAVDGVLYIATAKALVAIENRSASARRP